MEFKKYQHLERFGTSEVQNIELGECYVFPKIDGTNASVWSHDGCIQAGSRKRHLTIEKDNAGFYEWVCQQESIKNYLNENPTHRLFGEWLVPHALKTYKDDAWRRFYVFDVVVDLEEEEPSGEKFKYLHYDEYKPLLEAFEIDYLPYICKITNGSYEQFINQMMHNVFLIQDGKGYGEGVVLKQYGFQNKYGRTTWAKIVTSEFKEKHAKVHGGHEVKGKKLVEQEIANKYVTTALCEKVYAKIENDGGFTQRRIPQLLNTVYYDVVKEDCWNFVKENKNPTINFGTLQHFVVARVKECLPNLF
jgi:hypothetical protein